MMMLTQVPVAMDHFTFICLYPLSLLPLNHLATFVRSELCNPAKHFLQPSPKLGLLSTPPESNQVSEEQTARVILFSVQQMQ